MALSAEPTPYLFAVIDPETGTVIGRIGSDGRRAVEFARNTDCVVVRWKVQQGREASGAGTPSTVWCND